jgi:acetoin utilization deacetylase AcuC-like enzyme
MIGEKVRQMSDICGGKVIDLIASGYHRGVLPYAWMSLIAGLADFKVTVEEPSAIPASLRIDTHMPETIKLVSEIKGIQKEYWRCFQD